MWLGPQRKDKMPDAQETIDTVPYNAIPTMPANVVPAPEAARVPRDSEWAGFSAEMAVILAEIGSEWE